MRRALYKKHQYSGKRVNRNLSRNSIKYHYDGKDLSHSQIWRSNKVKKCPDVKELPCTSNHTNQNWPAPDPEAMANSGTFPPKTVTFKVEPGRPQEDEGRISYIKINVTPLDVKEEFERPERITQTADSIHLETVTFKTEPEPLEEDGGVITYEIEIEEDREVKNEFSQSSERIIQTTALWKELKPGFYCSRCNCFCSSKSMLEQHFSHTHTTEIPLSFSD